MKTKTINGIKFQNSEMWVKGELKTIFTMTKDEMDYMLPRVTAEYWEHRQTGDGRTARAVATVCKRLIVAIKNHDILSNKLNK